MIYRIPKQVKYAIVFTGLFLNNAHSFNNAKAWVKTTALFICMFMEKSDYKLTKNSHDNQLRFL